MKILISTLIFFMCNLIFQNFASAEKFSETDSADKVMYDTTKNLEQYFQTLPQKKSYKVNQRPLLIQGANNIEIEKFVRTLKNPVAYRFLNYLYVAGTFKNFPVVIARTEQGVANSAASTVLALEKFNPCAVINQGIAGGHFPALHVNDIVIGEKSINIGAYKSEFLPAGAGIDITAQDLRGTFSFDAEENIFKLFPEFRADSKLLEIAKSVATSHKEFKTVSGTISSADSWISEIDHINFLHEKYGSFCEEMETNAAAQICKSAGVPFIGIRAISNNITNGETFSVETVATCQNFVLLVAENFIETIGKRQQALEKN